MKNRKAPSLLTIVIVIILLIYYALTSNKPGTSPSSPQPPTPIAPQSVTPGSGNTLDQRTKTSGCIASNGLPDHACTPGAIFPDATKDQICTSGYSSNVRNVPDSVKNQAYAEYGIASHTPGQYEVDHLISLELGGSNDIANLWPEPADPKPGFHEKDKVENYLHDQVCNGSMSLQDAQYKIANDWFTVYQTLP
jgi:hypothetical protein